MKQPGYYEKRDRAIEQDAAVKKVIAKDAAPKGAKTYIKKRLEDLKKVRGH
jgi:hypothetical protein